MAGPFLFRHNPHAASVAARLVLALVVSSCVPAQGGRPQPEAPEPPEPPIAEGALSPAAEAAAAGLLRDARRFLDQEEYTRAQEASRRVVEEFPAAPGSSEALLILAEATLRLGDPAGAAEAADHYVRLLPAGDERTDQALLLLGTARVREGRFVDGVRTLLRIAGTDPGIRTEALERIRQVTPRMDASTLEGLAEEIPDAPLSAPVLAELGAARSLRGDDEGARRLAERALAAGAEGPDRELAEATLTGRVDEVLGRSPPLGAILPSSGSPTMRRFAAFVEEGIRVALAESGRASRRPVRLEILDDEGKASVETSLVEALERGGAIGVVGPLLDVALEAAARARTAPTPIVSPTARYVPEGLEAVYSLLGPDPGAARSVARHALEQGLRRVVSVYPSTYEARFEARAFGQEFTESGGALLAEIQYDSGSTHFADPLDQAAKLQPDALFLPLPPADVRVLAPQVTFFGLDSLQIRVLGTAGWTAEDVRRNVDPRHTNGVVATTAQLPGRPSEAYRRFVAEYEALHRKTLRSGVPALGYDAASLILEAFRSGARTPGDVRAALESIRDFPGASGTLSVLDGRIVRRHYVVRFEDRELMSIAEYSP